MIIVKLFILSFHHHGFKNINANHSIQKVQLIWEMKEDKIIYTKALPRIRFVWYFIYGRYSEKCFTQIYKAFYGDAMLVSLWGAQIWPLETNRSIYFLVSPLMREFLAWGTQKDYKKSNFYSETRNA